MDVNAKRLQALSKAAAASGVGSMLSIRPGSIQAMAADHSVQPSMKRLAGLPCALQQEAGLKERLLLLTSAELLWTAFSMNMLPVGQTLPMLQLSSRGMT